MLTSLRLENFRGFNKHQLALNSTTIIVGRNNAGKSTIVEALRLISIVTNRYRNLRYHPPPAWSDLPRRLYGMSPSLRNMEINFDTAFHRYNDPPGVIRASFNGGSSVTVYLAGEDKLHAVIEDARGKIIDSKEKARSVNLPVVNIMPQVAPVQREERILAEDYVRSAISIYPCLSSFSKSVKCVF